MQNADRECGQSVRHGRRARTGVRLTTAGTLELGELMARQDVLDLAEPEWGYRRTGGGPSTPVAATEAQCGEWMPVAKVRCALGRGHKGGHRSRR